MSPRVRRKTGTRDGHAPNPTPSVDPALWVEAFRHAAYGIAIGDARVNRIVVVNPAYAALAGRTPERLVGHRIREIYVPADRTKVARALREADECGAAHFEASVLLPDGAEHPVEVDVRALRGDDGKPAFRIATMRSISRRLEAVHQQAELYRRMRALSRRLESAQEIERKRLATTLHEGLLQSVAAVNLGLERVKHELARDGAEPRSALPAIAELQQQLGGVTRAAREAIVEVRPSGLEHLGLWPVLSQHVERWGTAAGIDARVRFEATPRLRDDVALTGFRAVQECLRNVAQHARASRVAVHSRRVGRRVEIVVDDDGLGIAPGDLEKPDAFGLLGAMERTLIVGGEVHAARRRPRGTRVVVRLPVAPVARAARPK